MLDNLVQKSLEHSTEKPGDYMKDGVLCCGVCGKPKQKKIHFPNMGDRLVGIACDCTESEKASVDDANDTAAFETMMERRRIEDSIVDPSYRKVTFADDDGANPKISKICRKYVDQWDKVSTENIGILFRGPVGTGKSFFACCIANELLKKRVPTAVTSFPRLLNLLQNSKDRQGLLDRLSTYKLLVIDDLGVERDFCSHRRALPLESANDRDYEPDAAGDGCAGDDAVQAHFRPRGGNVPCLAADRR